MTVFLSFNVTQSVINQSKLQKKKFMLMAFTIHNVQAFRGVRSFKKVNFLNAQPWDIFGRLNTLDGRLNTLDGRLNTLDGRLNIVEEKLGKLEEKVDKLGDKVDKIAQSMSMTQIMFVISQVPVYYMLLKK